MGVVSVVELGPKSLVAGEYWRGGGVPDESSFTDAVSKHF
jgi:hypothetical protein